LIITERIIKDKDNIEKFFKEKSETLQNIATIGRPGALPSAVNETKDAITERIIHTVNMMKEVLQSNLSLRETIQKQSEQLDNLNADIFMLQIENEDLRDRLGILEEYTGKDSYLDMAKLVKEKKVLENRVKHLEKTSMNWAVAQFQATRSGFHTTNENFKSAH
jgi:cell division protein FtsB